MLGNVSGGLAKATGQGASEAGYVLGLWLGRPCGLAWLYLTNSGVGARAPETKVTVCAQTVAARWAGCCWAPSGRVGSGYKAGWWESGWAGWLGGGVGGRAPETKVTVQRGTRTVQWAGSGLWAVGRTCWVGCALEISSPKKSDQITLHFENLGVVHANGAVGWACPAGTMWHTFGWWAVAGPRAVAEKVRIWESSRCHRETRSTLPLSIGAIAIATPQLPLYLWSIY
ncbi:uncharacterized protein MONOS_16912 [Monocercomonoides exilis]|uniref:uncharacterized protein n=1 Tax=Monocercomonoides exilis TaxID=2049356 RepID=UPI00355A479C|nr:hypothetical protein MONOS_16912 [Monocercomonoides exilis]